MIIETLIEKGVMPIVSTFVGAVLAFWAQSHRNRQDLHRKKCDSLVAAYRIVTANLGTLSVFKANFLSERLEEFNCLREFCLEYANPVPDEQREVLRNQWISAYRGLFLSLAQDEQSAGLIKNRWERPQINPLDESGLMFVAHESPTLLTLMSFVKSTEHIFFTALDNRERIAISMEIYHQTQDAVRDGSVDFVRTLAQLMMEISILSDAVDRMLALNFALVCLFENYYFRHNGSINFKRVKFAERNFKMIPNIEDWIEFCGNEEDRFIVRQRLEYAQNTIKGHRELNYPTGYIPKGL